MTESWMEIYPHLQFLISYVLRPPLFFYSQLYSEQKIGKNKNRAKPLIMDHQKRSESSYTTSVQQTDHLPLIDFNAGRYYHKTMNLQEVDTSSNVLLKTNTDEL